MRAWIRESDIRDIAATGLTSVRVPVGYWVVRDAVAQLPPCFSSPVDPRYARGSLRFLDPLVTRWAVKYSVAVMLSLRAHQGSQNPHEHSAPTARDVASWGALPANVASSLFVVEFLAARYRSSAAFLGLDVLNEPSRGPTAPAVLRRFYQDALTAACASPPTARASWPCRPWSASRTPRPWPGGWTRASSPTSGTSCAPTSSGATKGSAPRRCSTPSTATGTRRLGPRRRRPTGRRSSSARGPWAARPAGTPALLDDTDSFRAFGQRQLDMLSRLARGGWAFWSWKHSDELAGKRNGWGMRALLRDGGLELS